MPKAMLWFKCAAMHDPVRPVVHDHAQIGWVGKYRHIDLTIERNLKPEELLKRMKGWFTADVHQVLQEINGYGDLILYNNKDLLVEAPDKSSLDNLAQRLKEVFADEAWLEPLSLDQ